MLGGQKIIKTTNILDTVKYIDGLKAIIFDMDDTLYSEKEYIRSGYRKIAELFPQIEGADRQLWNLFLEGKPAIDEFLKQQNLFSDENKEKCLTAYRLQKPDIHLYPGVKAMLLDLRKRYLVGLITDGRPEGQWANIVALRIEPLIDEIIVTDELGGIKYRKPNDVAFRLMADRMCMSFEQMCYIGDNARKDFMAPQKLGMRCIWVRNEDGLYVLGG